MPEKFVIDIIHNTLERSFDAVFISFGYGYRIEVMVDGTPVIFEPDEENKFRACIPGAHTGPKPDPLLLQSITTALEKAFR